MTLRKKRFPLIQIAGVVLFILSLSSTEVMAVERWLVSDTSQCADVDQTVNPCYTNLADAVTAANATGDTIKILASDTSYAADVTLTKSITIYGQETARTVLTGTITVSGVTTPMNIRNILFIDGSPAILVQSNASIASSNVTIENNVFNTPGVAVQVNDTSSPSIIDNTFYGNSASISSIPNTLNIVNNIFSNNTLAISTNVALDSILNNLFWQNTDDGPAIVFNSADVAWKGNVNTLNPQFVDVLQGDFHLLSTTTTSTSSGNTSSGANSINNASPPDIGAYGGGASDTIPFLVSSLTGTSTSDTTINLTWPLNNCYMIQGYNVYFNVNKAGPPYDNATTPTDAGIPASFPYTLTVSSSGTTTLAAPTNLSSTPSSGALTISWAPVENATGYLVSYKLATASTYTQLPLRYETSITISGLTDPAPDGTKTWYDITVQAYHQTQYHIAVKSYYDPDLTSKEALVFSPEVIVSVGTSTYGPVATITDFPEPIIMTPNLPNKGCFIATAAYGYYDAPQVQALRVFRDRYLETNSAGRAFVSWYYEYGPIGAAALNAHPWLKPVVRTALMPAVDGALFLTKTSTVTQLTVLFLFSLMIAALVIYKKNVGRGGSR